MSGRCRACNNKLSDFEMTRKYAGTTEYVDLCNHCYKTIDGLLTEERVDLMHDDETLTEEDIMFLEEPFHD